jgi:hypothetical protein
MATLANTLQLLDSPRFPAELVLKTIQHLPFGDGKKLDSIRSVSPRLNDLITTYERSVTQFFMRKELRHATCDFPCKESCDLKWLAQCVARYDVVDAVLDELTWRENCMALKPHNVAVVNAGLLLLYQLISIGTYTSTRGMDGFSTLCTAFFTVTQSWRCPGSSITVDYY